jgi:hypothetical protein
MKILNFIKNILKALGKELPEAKSFVKSCGVSLAMLGSFLCVFWVLGWIAEQFIPETIFPNGNPGTLIIGVMVVVALCSLICAVFLTMNIYVTLKKIWDES